jgi:hypothetical protein
MKHFKVYEEFIFEIGDSSSKKYKYKINGKFSEMSEFDKRVYVKFKTESKLEYTLTVININSFLDIDFTADGEYNETNRGEMFSIMATIMDVIERILGENTGIIRGFRYEPKEKANDEGLGRDRLYRIFIEKSMKRQGKSISFTQQGGTVFGIIKD